MSYGRTLFFVAASLALTCLWWCPLSEVEAVVVASSSIEHCERRGGAEPLPCEKKMVVTLAVDSQQAAGAEEVVALRDAIDRTRDGGAERVEFEPIRLLVNKSQVKYIYPLFYARAFNAEPYEENIATGLVEGCSDAFVPSATCGLVRNGSGSPIPYSQGFCCSCSVCQVAGLCSAGGRGLQSCDVFGKTAMASCLRFGELWYNGYNIGPGSAWYRVRVALVLGGANGTASVKRSTFELGPDVTMGFSADFGAWARLVGDFVPPETPLDLTGKMLFVPARPKMHERVAAGPREWLLLDKHHVSINGRECNKVGVSYEAFATQGSRCQLRRGSCLADQLEDYRARDLEAEALGRRGAYMARFFGDFCFDTPNATAAASSSSPRLSYLMRCSLTTMVTITISADRLRYVQSVSPGKIVSVSVQKTFRSSSRDGVLKVAVRNTGAVTAQYTLSVGNCTGDVFPIAAQPVSVSPQDDVVRQFDLNVQDTETKGVTIRCAVTLRDSRGNVTDRRFFVFQVTGVVKTNGAQGTEVPAERGRSAMGAGGSACARCEWYDPFCLWWNDCLLQLLVRVVVVVGVSWVVCVVWNWLSCCANDVREEPVRPNLPVHVLPAPAVPRTSPCASVVYVLPRQQNAVS